MPRASRRRVVAAALLGLAGIGTDVARPLYEVPGDVPPSEPGPLRIGLTFSPVEAEYMSLDVRSAFESALDLAPAFLRLGAYWNRIEQARGQYDFSDLDWYLAKAASHRIPVTLAFGLKAPVFPEFHFPNWILSTERLPPIGLVTRSARLRDFAHTFTERVISEYASADTIARLQVENEPFEPILYTNGWTLDEDFLRNQVEIVRSRDRLSRPIVLNVYVPSSVAVNMLARLHDHPIVAPLIDVVMGRRPRGAIIALADVVGLDVFPSVGWTVLGQTVYFRATRPADLNPLRAWRRDCARAGKRAMVLEAQAKPWEPGKAVHIDQMSYPSFGPGDIVPLVRNLVRLGIREIGLWGVEHWFWHRNYGDPAWWANGAGVIEAAHDGRLVA